MRISTRSDVLRAIPGARRVRERSCGSLGLLIVTMPWWNWLLPGRVSAARRRLQEGLPACAPAFGEAMRNRAQHLDGLVSRAVVQAYLTYLDDTLALDEWLASENRQMQEALRLAPFCDPSDVERAEKAQDGFRRFLTDKVGRRR